MVEQRLVRASAGTGKTYQLTQTYAGLVLEHGLRPSQVVAITFTRKAAFELQRRIRARLRQAEVGPAVLAELSRAPIGNFHGLALQLSRALVHPSWGARQILGDGEDAALFAEACEAAWFHGDAASAGAVGALAPYFAVDELPPALWDALARAREDGLSPNEALVACIDAAACQAMAHGRLVSLRDHLVAAQATVEGRSREKLADLAAAAVPAAQAAPDAWAAGWRSLFGRIDRRGALRDIFTKEDQALLAEAVDGVRADIGCAELVAPLRVLLCSGWQLYQRAKQQRRAADFADLIGELVTVLQQDVSAHAAVRRRFAAVLVDEAQDTNTSQRQMVNLLSGRSGPACDAAPSAHLVVVGDWKQSIYTFRGADPRSFASFADDIRAAGGVEQTLAHSRRSTPAVVAGVNHLGAALFGERYEPLLPFLDDVPGAGMHWLRVVGDAELAPGVAEARAIADLVRRRLDDGAAVGDFAILLSTMALAPQYARALADVGVPAVLGGGGGFYSQPEISDVLALVGWLVDPRARLDAAVALRSPLFSLSDSALLALTTDRGALDELRLGRLQAPPADFDASETAALLRCNAQLAELSAAARTLGAAAFLARADEVLQVRATYLAMPFGETRVANLNRLCELAMRSDAAHGRELFAFWHTQDERRRRGHDEPLSSVPAAERCAVTVASVHASKGLQYPVVLLASLARKGRQDTAPLRYCQKAGLVFRPRGLDGSLHSTAWRQSAVAANEAADAEARRLLYVAATRAEREIWFVAPEPMAKTGFARYLVPWQAAAQAAGVLRQHTWRPPAACQAAQPAPAAAPAPVAHPLPLRAPPGSLFDVTVTELCRWNTAPPRPLQRGLTPDDAAAQTDPPLDPLGRGRLAHSILAALERCRRHRTIEAFVAAELRQAGYDPTCDRRLAGLTADVEAFLRSPLGATLTDLPDDSRRHEIPFCYRCDAAPYGALLRGQLDLLFWDAEGPTIVDYKHAHAEGDLTPYLLQLDAYALAVAELCAIRGPIRTRLVFLRDRCPPHAHVATEARQAAIRARLSAWVHAHAAWQPPALRTA